MANRAALTPAAKKGSRIVGKKVSKEVKVENVAMSVSDAISPNNSVNGKYLECLMADIDVIKTEWPSITQLDPLPIDPGSCGGFGGLVGYGEPFNADVFDARVQDQNFALTTHINFMWQDLVNSLLITTVPLYRERLIEYSDNHLQTPSVLKHALVINVEFSVGKELPRGGLFRLSPDIPCHALIYKVAQVLRTPNTEASEKLAWLRVLLSSPVTFIKRDTYDSKYAEVNSLREDLMGASAAVEETVRQLCLNLGGFKSYKERVTGLAMTASMMSTFYKDNIRLSQGNKHLSKKSSMDALLTLMDRFWSIPGLDELVRASESVKGKDSFWNSLYRLQEIVYRCQKTERITWVCHCIADGLQSGKYAEDEISVQTLKTGPRSVTDVFLTAKQLKEYLLGTWLDGMGFPSNIADKCREIFKSHASWRQLWAPHKTRDTEFGDVELVVDTTFIFQWPQVGKDLLNFIEACVYLPSASDEWQYRRAIKDCTPASELMTRHPWCDAIANMKEKLRASPCIGGVGGGGPCPGDDGASTKNDKRKADDNGEDDEDTETAKLLKDSGDLKQAVDSLMSRQVCFLVEQVSLAAQRMQFETTPLCMVRGTKDSGNVNILFDCNGFGESDHAPDRRPCPIGKEKMDIPLRAILAARHGTEESSQVKSIQMGDLFTVISGGKDRRRALLKSLKTQMSSRRGFDKSKTYCRTIMLHVSEASWRARRSRSRGHAKLTQAIYIVGCHQTFSSLPFAAFKTIGGSNKSDVMGPVDLDKSEDLPTMSLAKKKAYLGKRFVLVGGKAPSSSESEGDRLSGSDNVETENPLAGGKPPVVKDPPLSYHGLPVSVATNLHEAYNVKHVIDLAPSPHNLAFETLRRGGSYVGVCSTPAMAAWLKEKLFKRLVRALVDKNEIILHDSRFTAAAAVAAGHLMRSIEISLD